MHACREQRHDGLERKSSACACGERLGNLPVAVLERDLVREQPVRVAAARRVRVDLQRLLDGTQARPPQGGHVQRQVELSVLLCGELRTALEQPELLGLLARARRERLVKVVVLAIQHPREHIR